MVQGGHQPALASFFSSSLGFATLGDADRYYRFNKTTSIGLPTKGFVAHPSGCAVVVVPIYFLNLY
jgi:hypothetical protein